MMTAKLPGSNRAGGRTAKVNDGIPREKSSALRKGMSTIIFVFCEEVLGYTSVFVCGNGT